MTALSRRALLLGGALVPLGSAVAAPIPLKVRWSTSASTPVFPLVAPAAGWTGSPTTPGSQPSPWPARGNAQPTMHWMQSSQIRGVGATRIAVFADAAYGTPNITNGMQYVDFWVGGTVQRSTLLSQYTYTDVNGISRTEPAFIIDVDCTAAVAAHPGGSVRVYATGRALDGTMNDMVIGPLIIYPRAAEFDPSTTFVATVNSGGGATYTSLQTALRAAAVAMLAGKEAFKITITGGATYEWGSPIDFNFPWSQGVSVVTVAPGVNASIFRGASFDPNRTGNNTISDAWVAYTYVQNIEFRGAAGGTLTIDRRNFCDIRPTNNASIPENLHFENGTQLVTGAVYFNGVTVSTSEGTQKSTYWNAQYAPPIRIVEFNGNTVVPWMRDSTVLYQSNGAVFVNYGLNNQVNQCFATPHESETQMVCGEYYANATLANEQYFTNAINSLDIGYSGAATVATLAFDGANTLTFTEDAVLKKSMTLYQAAYQPLGNGTTQFTLFSQIAAFITASLPGWTWANLNDAFSCWTLGSPKGMLPFSVNVKGAPKTLRPGFDIHSEYVHLTTTARQFLLINTTVRNCTFGTSWFNNETASGLLFDSLARNNVADTNGVANGGTGSYQFGRHARWENNTVQDNFNVYQGLSDSYSRVTQNAVPFMQNLNGAYSDLIPTNNMAGGSPPAGSGNVNLGTVNDATWAAYFVNRTAGDFTPTGTLSGTTFTKINPYDGLGQARAALDAAGAWKIGGAAPTWPF